MAFPEFTVSRNWPPFVPDLLGSVFDLLWSWGFREKPLLKTTPELAWLGPLASQGTCFCQAQAFVKVHQAPHS